jgi:ankyrin repeat protein
MRKTPVHVAVGAEKTQILALPLAHGADMDSRDEVGWIPLHIYMRDIYKRCSVL